MDETTSAAFERLLEIAQSDTGQARRVAGFVLAWWNAGTHGGFDIADLFAVDVPIAADMLTVFDFLSRCDTAVYPEAYQAEIEAIIRQWRPEVWARTQGRSAPKLTLT